MTGRPTWRRHGRYSLEVHVFRMVHRHVGYGSRCSDGSSTSRRSSWHDQGLLDLLVRQGRLRNWHPLFVQAEADSSAVCLERFTVRQRQGTAAASATLLL